MEPFEGCFGESGLNNSSERSIPETLNGEWLPVPIRVFSAGRNIDCDRLCFPAITLEDVLSFQLYLCMIHCFSLYVRIKVLEFFNFEVVYTDSFDKVVQLAIRLLTTSRQLPGHEVPNGHVVPRPRRWVPCIAATLSANCWIKSRHRGFSQFVCGEERIWVIGWAMAIFTCNTECIKHGMERVQDMENYSTS